MKNNKGFISISIVYSFFLIFLLLLVFIVEDFANNRILLRNIKTEIKKDFGTGTASNEDKKLSSVIKKRYKSDGQDSLYLHDGFGDYGTSEAGDYSYRFAGSSPNNWVCFGIEILETTTCPNDNLYRIIGVFDNRTKIIKAFYGAADFLGSDNRNGSTNNYMWASNTSNDWSSSSLKDTVLKMNYYYNMERVSAVWRDLILRYNWQIGGISSISSPKNIYSNEISKSPDRQDIEYTWVGLMYVSDYLFAGVPSSWSNTNGTTSNNWLNIDKSGGYEWTITKNKSNGSGVYRINSSGKVESVNISTSVYAKVRPVVYLNNSTMTVGTHSGTQSDPYRLEVHRVE